MYIGPWQELRLGQLLSEHQRLVEQTVTQQMQILKQQQLIQHLGQSQSHTASPTAAVREFPVTVIPSLSLLPSSSVLSPSAHATARSSRRPGSAALPPIPNSSPSSSTRHLPGAAVKPQPSRRTMGRRAEREAAAAERAQQLERMRAMYSIKDRENAAKALLTEDRKEPEPEPEPAARSQRPSLVQPVQGQRRSVVSGGGGFLGAELLIPPSGSGPLGSSPSSSGGSSAAISTLPSPSSWSSSSILTSPSTGSSAPSTRMSVVGAETSYLRELDIDVESAVRYHHGHAPSVVSPVTAQVVDESRAFWADLNDIPVTRRPSAAPESDRPRLPDRVDVSRLSLSTFPTHLSQLYRVTTEAVELLSSRHSAQQRELHLIDAVFMALHSDASAATKLPLCHTLRMHLSTVLESSPQPAPSLLACMDLFEHWHAVLVESSNPPAQPEASPTLPAVPAAGLGSRLRRAEFRIEELLALREEELRTGVAATAEELRRALEDKEQIEGKMEQSVRLKAGESTKPPPTAVPVASPIHSATAQTPPPPPLPLDLASALSSSPVVKVLNARPLPDLPRLKSLVSAASAASTMSDDSFQSSSAASSVHSSPSARRKTPDIGGFALPAISRPHSPSITVINISPHGSQQSSPRGSNPPLSSPLSIFRAIKPPSSRASMEMSAGGRARVLGRLEPIRGREGVEARDEVTSASLRMEEEVDDVMAYVDEQRSYVDGESDAEMGNH